jgi:RHS repeat-associated protein
MYNFPNGTNNGRVSNMVDNILGEQVNYTYDQLNRLTQASDNSSTAPWGLSFTYDGFGNLLQQSKTAGNPPQMSLQVNPANNQIANDPNYVYDANGNLTTGPNGATYYYDAANRMVSDGSTSYYYNPQGQRIMVTGAQNPVIYAYGVRGELLGQYLPVWGAPGKAQIVGSPRLYFNGMLIYETGSPGGGKVVADRLGSVGYSTHSINYYPYGGEITTSNDGRGKFATYWRDSAGLDYAGQRYYANGIGRFLTPDPGGMATANPNDPASWNRYAYVNGDPTNFMDPGGTNAMNPDSGGNSLCWGTSIYMDGVYYGCTGGIGGMPGGGGGGGGGGNGDGFCGGSYFDPTPNPACDAQIPPPVARRPNIPAPSCDDLLEIEIQGYLTLRHSPLARLAWQFVSDGRANDVDPRFVVGLARVESTWAENIQVNGKQGPNNAWSLSTHYWLGYPSLSAALGDVNKLLGGPLYINGGNGIVDVASIYAKYEGEGPSIVGPAVDLINQDLRRLGGNPNNVEFPCKGFN